MLRLVFWQHIMSMIDLPYIINCASNPSVKEVVIVGKSVSAARKNMGWDIDFPNMDKCTTIIDPTTKDIQEILKKDLADSIHLFTGLSAFPHVFRAFKMSLDFNVKRAIISERPLTYAAGVDWIKPLWLHKIKFLLQNGTYIKAIDYVFEIGEDTSHYYRNLSSKWKVFPFAYCTRSNFEPSPQTKPEEMQFCYVGSLCKRKNVITLLKAAKWLNRNGYDGRYKINLVGNGQDKPMLKKFTEKNKLGNVTFLGVINNKELPQFLVSQDVFVLPSIHDGWGAVLNEALQAGLYTLSSDRCGGKEMLSKTWLGNVFEMGNYKQLAYRMKDAIDACEDIRSEQDKRRLWAEQSISGIVVATYLVECLSGHNINAPWR